MFPQAFLFMYVFNSSEGLKSKTQMIVFLVIQQGTYPTTL